MRILRCELCAKPCTLTKLDDEEVRFCPVTGERAAWRQINTGRTGRTGSARQACSQGE